VLLPKAELFTAMCECVNTHTHTHTHIHGIAVIPNPMLSFVSYIGVSAFTFPNFMPFDFHTFFTVSFSDILLPLFSGYYMFRGYNSCIYQLFTLIKRKLARLVFCYVPETPYLPALMLTGAKVIDVFLNKALVQLFLESNLLYISFVFEM
jgi:hypothetical protein